ncbi:hypothetical protein HPB49_014336 [Dermacentor silvarum]|uniref:Uncharacterized protein n=1 Tax=Dermacentor silvarum TaxID=543639 RepID=A0ACB8CFC9_DERSI|nr:hypothetical protein HPB49_014336 [Dermacentor silvarum]
MWARHFSPSDILQVENLGLLRSVVHIFGFKAEKQEALTLSLGLLVVHELGWMTHRGIADVTLELAGLPPSSHTLCCLIQINVPKAFLQLRAHSTGILCNSDSFPAKVLPEPSCNGRFFADWLNVMVKRLRLQEQDVTNDLKPCSLLRHVWNFHGALTVVEDYFVFPFYDSDLPPAANYRGPGRLIADDVLRGLFQELVYN